MIYLVNKKTKEHRRYEDAINWPDCDARLVEADADGWIPWLGDPECPVPSNQKVEVKFHQIIDAPTMSEMPESLYWDHRGYDGDIIAYRPIFDTKYVTVEGIDTSYYDWWTEGKHYAVVEIDGVEGIYSDDGDFYALDQNYGRGLATGGRFDPVSDNEEKESLWNGVGDPPVGTVCDCDHNGSNQGIVTVRYIGSEMCVLFNHAYMEEQCGAIIDYTFRPLHIKAQLAEDEAVEEMRVFLNDQFKSPNKKPSPIELCRTLYRAGYRKMETSND